MPIELVTTPYGRDAAAVLHERIAAAKADEPLAPVAVVVPTNSVGVATRRLLASGELGPVTARGDGIVGVTFLTVYRLAELLAAPTLAAAGRRPVSTPVVAAAVRSVLARDPGVFGPVAQHPATEEALVAAHRELGELDGDALDVLARQSPRSRDVVRVHRETTAALRAAWYTEHDLMRVATDLVGDGAPLPGGLRALLVHLPQRISAPQARLLAALAARVPTTVVLGLTGVRRADASVLASARRLGVELQVERCGAITPPVGSAVWSFSDPDDEVRAVVRGVVDALRDGVPLERIGICYSAADPYARLLEEHLGHAGIAHNGSSVRSLSDTVLGRALQRLLALPDHDFRRDDVFALLAGAPLLDGKGRPADTATWERISRAAGVVGGAGEWRTRLDRYAAELSDADHDVRERERVARLREFVEGLVADLAPDRVPARWSEKVRWAHALVRRWVGDERRRTGWPPFEQEAARRVEAALDRLAGLDAVEQEPSLDVFRRTLELELDAVPLRVGRLGEGVFVGPVALALGAEFERLFVCGLADGWFPASVRDDPLLGDVERAAVAGELPLRADRADDDHRALLAALASTSGERVLCLPRGSLRRSTEHVPSRFLLDTVEALTGRRELPHGEPWCREVASFVDGLGRAPFPATRHERDVQAMLAGDPPAAPALARAVALVQARRSRSLTRFDGNLAHLADRVAAVGPTADGVVVSPTRLEQWARCPHAYFVRYVLGVEPVEQPEAVVTLSPLERGSVVHAVLERYVSGHLGSGDDARRRLHAIADEELAHVAARGVTGRRLLWQREQRLIHAELDAWFDADTRWRAEHGLETLATELHFAGVEIRLSDGRVVRMRGAADRVDRRADGTLVVFDYKNGSPVYYEGLSAEDPVAGGDRLQLPVYALAARARFAAGAPVPVEAYYWFVGRGGNRWIGYAVDDAVLATFDGVLRTIVDGIEAGCFPARPSPPGPRPFVDCPYCDPDGLGTADRWREWERKQGDPALAPYRALFTSDEEDGEAGGGEVLA